MSGIEKFKPQASPISGGGGGGTWGSITGTLSAQTDLQNALNAKQNTITTGTTAQYFRGDLSLATFPTNVSTFTNDSGYITSSALSNYVAKTGNETIAGLKTFTSDIYGTKDSGRAFRVGSLSGGDNNIWLGPSAISPTAANFVISTSINNSFTIFNSPSGRMYFGINNLYLFNVSSSGAYFGGTLTSATAKLHISAGSASANTAPLQFTSGTLETVARGGVFEYNNTPHFTNSDNTRRHIALAPNTTKVTAGAPYTNDGYIIINIGGTDFKVMTTA